jgi:exonuclease III
MLDAFFRLHHIDMLLMQGMTSLLTLGFQGYTIHYNIGTSRRGTAILTRDTILVTNLYRIPYGRTIAASLGTLLIVKVYAPCGNCKRSDREAFFNNDLPFLLGSAPADILLGGEFSCILEAVDSTGHGSYIRSLATLVQGYSLRDTWQARPDSQAYTYHTTHGASKIDRYYLYVDLLARKTGIATVADAFSDHLAVLFRLSRCTTVIRRGRGMWKLNRDILTSEHVMETLQQQWRRWKQQQHWYPNITLWWVRYFKKRIRQIFQSMEADLGRDFRRPEDFYYECIQDLVRIADMNPDAFAALHHFKAKVL